MGRRKGCVEDAPVDRRRADVGVRLLLPLIVVGIGSVLYWHSSELRTTGGDLRWYVEVQYYPILAIPLLAFLFPSVYAQRTHLWRGGSLRPVEGVRAAGWQYLCAGTCRERAYPEAPGCRPGCLLRPADAPDKAASGWVMPKDSRWERDFVRLDVASVGHLARGEHGVLMK